MAGVTTSGSALFELSTDLIIASVPYIATGSGLIELLPDSSLAISGIETTGNALAEFTEDIIYGGGVSTAGTAFVSFAALNQTAIVGSSGAVGTAYLELIATNIIAFDGAVSDAFLELAASGVGNCGGVAAGAGFEEFAAFSAFANSGATGLGSGLLYISADGTGYSTILLTPENPAALDILKLPIVAFSMNVLTKGISAYTDNVGGKVPALVSTPVSNMGSKKKKCVSDLYAHMRSTGDVGVSTISDEVKGRTLTNTITYDDIDGVHTQRAKLSRGTEGVNWQFFLESLDATAFEVEFIEVVPRISESRTS